MASLSSHKWPTVLKEDQITLRPLRLRDRSAWLAVRKTNRAWLSQWEATSPISHENKNLPSYFEMVNYHRGEGRAGRSLTLAIWFEKNLITTRAVRRLTSYGFEELGLHRIEINLRPENAASKRVAEKAGYVFEGLRPRYLHIDGSWRDHLCYVKENPRI
jgi:ribosomal-protein-alanine N-acetyltransferase